MVGGAPNGVPLPQRLQQLGWERLQECLQTTGCRQVCLLFQGAQDGDKMLPQVVRRGTEPLLPDNSVTEEDHVGDHAAVVGLDCQADPPERLVLLLVFSDVPHRQAPWLDEERQMLWMVGSK